MATATASRQDVPQSWPRIPRDLGGTPVAGLIPAWDNVKQVQRAHHLAQWLRTRRRRRRALSSWRTHHDRHQCRGQPLATGPGSGRSRPRSRLCIHGYHRFVCHGERHGRHRQRSNAGDQERLPFRLRTTQTGGLGGGHPVLARSQSRRAEIRQGIDFADHREAQTGTGGGYRPDRPQGPDGLLLPVAGQGAQAADAGRRQAGLFCRMP
jgi:hypothetical protein